MEVIVKAARVVLYTLFTVLILGIANIVENRILWLFIVIIFTSRAYEVFNPVTTALYQWYKSYEQSMWFSSLTGLVFLTNFVLPILDFRYRTEVYWASPFPRDLSLWSWGGLLLLVGVLVIRIRTVENLTKMGLSFQSSVSKKNTAKKGIIHQEALADIFSPQLSRSFHSANILFYFGIALFFTSLWALVALFVVVLPVTLIRIAKDKNALKA